jgi:hypothetical protein
MVSVFPKTHFVVAFYNFSIHRSTVVYISYLPADFKLQSCQEFYFGLGGVCITDHHRGVEGFFQRREAHIITWAVLAAVLAAATEARLLLLRARAISSRAPIIFMIIDIAAHHHSI